MAEYLHGVYKTTTHASAMRIGILEDDPSQLELLGHWVALAGHDPRRFDHGNQLLRAIRDESFDLLILDWNLPDLSGIDVLRQVRQRSKVPRNFLQLTR